MFLTSLISLIFFNVSYITKYLNSDDHIKLLAVSVYAKHPQSLERKNGINFF